MNELKTTYNGGMPLELDDLRWTNDAIKDVIKGMLEGLVVNGEFGLKLQGCDVVDNTTYYSISSGYVYFSGEVFKVNAHNVTKGTGGTYIFQPVESYDPAGDETFADGTINRTYLKREAVVVNWVDDPDGYMLMTSGNYADVILNRLVSLQESWTSITTFYNGYAVVGGENFAVKKDQLGNIWLRGAAQSTNLGIVKVCDLPAGYEPTQKMTFLAHNGMNAYQVIIYTNGEVFASGGSCLFNFLNFKQ